MLGRPLLLLAPLALLLGGWAHIRAGDGPNDPALHFSRDYVIPIHVHSDGYDGLPFDEVRGAVEDALASWGLDDITVAFGRDPDGQDGDTPAMDGVNVVRFEHRQLPREVDPRTVLAFTSHTGVLCTGTIVESDITFNAVSVEWSTADRSRRADIETVMLHEAGHLLGLDHSDDRDAVMFPSIVERSRRALHRDDAAGVRALYNRDLLRACRHDSECAQGEACIFGAQSDESFGTFCGPRLGNAGIGQRCNAQADFCDTGCAAGYCLGDNVCSGVCRDDRDCPGELTCLAQDTGGGQIVNFCINLRECPDVDACGAGQACVVTLNPADDSVLRICVDGGGTRTGQPCRSSDQCEGALCYGGVCTELCDGNDDCGDPFACDRVEIPLGSGVTAAIGLCRVEETPCGRQADCADGLSCAYANVAGQVRSLCLPGAGGEAGEACVRGPDCRSAVCLDGTCSDVCRNDADCPLTMECQRIRFLGASVNACVLIDEPPPPEDDAAPPDPESDMGAAPVADAAPGRPDDAAPVPLVDARSGQPQSDAGTPVIIVAPGGGGDSGNEPSGCSAVPGPVGSWMWGLLLLSARRRRARAG